MNVKEKGQSGIYTKVYGYIPKDVERKQFTTEKGTVDLLVFDLVYDTGSISKETKAPITKGMRCEVAASKLGAGEILRKGSKLEVGGPLRVDYDKLKDKTYVSVRVAELKID
jgi:hypothetical protein